MDRITEEIAHFIGLFEITLEEARQREAYREFQAEEAKAPGFPDLLHGSNPFSAPYQLLGFEPGLAYSAPGPEVLQARIWTFVDYNPMRLPPEFGPAPGHYGHLSPAALVGDAGSLTLPDLETIGSVAIFISQKIQLSDNDYFGVGGHGLFFAATLPGDGAVIQLTSLSGALSPIDDLEMTGSSEGLIDFVATASQRLAEYSAEGGGSFVYKADTIEGTFVNGAAVGEAPKIEDYYTFGAKDEEEESEEEPHESGYTATPSSYHAEGSGLPHPSVSVETGGNQLINDAVLKSFWTAAPVTAVAGAHFELNAIIQINAWCDVDAVTSAIEGWWNGHAPTQAFNIATFERYDTTADANEGFSGDYPKHWVVKEIQGNLMIVNWLEQFTFMMDNDIGIISSSGVTTRISSGDNLAYNDIALAEIGFGYDLIIIGGNVYDANIIHQLNILCDNDLIGAVGGFEMSGNGSVSTSGNLLWNQAHIYNVGGADRFESLPEHYKAAMASLATGGKDLASFLSEGAFLGSGLLKVLYISGDLINVQYAKQTNILGDSDQVALAMHSMDPFAEADWTISTGSNVLINSAAIMDLDSTGKTYVGNGQYSSEVLVQADIISTDPEFGAQDPDKLVNEAVAFLDDDMASQNDDTGQSPYGQSDYESPQGDGLQTMLG